MNQFDTLCMNKASCDMFVRNMDWPDDCASKIGVRLQVITLSETKYQNITETIRVETIRYPDTQQETQQEEATAEGVTPTEDGDPVDEQIPSEN
jgi:hypothetical protein